MRRIVFLAFWLVLSVGMGGLRAADCGGRLAALELPLNLKMRGKPRQARWEPVERTLTELRRALESQACQVLFKEAFVSRQTDFFFPLLNNLLRTTPESSLEGAGIYTQDGSRLGEFSNRVQFEKNGSLLYYFQFKDRSGQLQSSGNRLLIDIRSGQPIFWLKWAEIADRVLFSGNVETTQ